MYAHRYVVPYDKSLSAPEFANETEAAEAEAPADADLCTQPVAVLTDWNCASAGDDFAVFAKGAPNVTLIGTNTAGGTGQLLLTGASRRLPFRRVDLQLRHGGRDADLQQRRSAGYLVRADGIKRACRARCRSSESD